MKAENSKAKFAEVDCTTSSDLCEKHGIKSYPTLRLYRSGFAPENFKGEKTAQGIVDFTRRLADAPTIDTDKYSLDGDVVVLTSNNFNDAINEFDGIMVKFFGKYYTNTPPPDFFTGITSLDIILMTLCVGLCVFCYFKKIPNPSSLVRSLQVYG